MPAPTPAARRLLLALGVLLLLIGARALVAGQGPILERQLGATAAAVLDRTLMAASWLAAAFLLTRALDVFVWQRRVPHLPRLLTDLAAAFVWLAAGLAIAGSVFAMPLAGILTTSGVAVAVLGFALRDMLASLFAGIALNLEGPFRIGDWLETGPDTVGQVIEIGWLTTRLTTQDGVGVVVPNAQLAKGGFRNFNQQPDPWRDQATIVLGYEVSPARAERVLRAALAQAVGRIGGGTEARIQACGEHGVVWQLRFPVRSYADRAEVRHRVQAAVLRHLFKAGIGPVPPRLDLFHAPMPPRALDHRTQLDGLLARSDLFGLVEPGDLAALSRAARPLRTRPGAVVVRQGEPGSSLFVVVEGVLDVEVALASGAPPSWARLLVPGDMFGEYSLLTGEPRSATVTARTDGLLFEVTKATLDPVLQRCPELAEAMSRTLALRQAARRDLELAGAASPAPADPAEPGLGHRIRAFFGLAPP